MMFKKLLLPSVSALLVFFGTFVANAWPLALLGYALFIYELAFHTEKVQGALIKGLLIGFASGGAGVIWMWDMLPLPVPGGLSPLTGIIVTALVWGITALLAGVTTAGVATVLFLLRKNIFFAPLAGLLFVAESVLRMWAYALYSYSPQSLFGPHFSQTALGYVLADNGYLLQIAYPFGIFALTFTLIALASALALTTHSLVTRTRSPQTVAALACTLVLLIYPAIASRSSHDGTSVSVTTLALGSVDPTGQIARELLADAAKNGADVILLPEGSDLRKLFPNEAPEAALERIFNGREALVLDSGYTNEPGGDSYARIEYHSTTEGVINEYRKLFLMPQAEYYPAIAKPLFSLAGDAKMNEHLTGTGRRLVRGDTLVSAEGVGVRVGALLCSEIMSPFLYRELVHEQGVTFLANLADPSWFHASRSLYTKTRQIARVHAVANRLPFALSSTDAPALIIGTDGTVLAESSWQEPTVLFAEVTIPLLPAQ